MMMNLGNLLRGTPSSFITALVELGKAGEWMTPFDDRGSLRIRLNGDRLRRLRPSAAEVVSLAGAGNPGNQATELLSMEALGVLAANGPKLVRTSIEQCEALSQVDIRLEVADYSQPFPAVMVTFPPAFVANVSREGNFPAPDYVLCRQRTDDPQYLFLNGLHANLLEWVATNAEFRKQGKSTGDNCNVIPHRTGVSIEDRLTLAEGLERGEVIGMGKLYRVALNMMLLLSNHPTKVEATNPGALARAREHLSRRRIPANEVEVATHVYNVGFVQDVVVRRHTAAQATPEEIDDACAASRVGPHPHWRRGHWRMQAYGPGRSERKRILIRPVFIGSGRFAGDMSTTGATYRRSGSGV